MYSNPNYGGGGSLHHSQSVSSRRGYTPSYSNQSGYSYSPGPPAGADPQLWQWFSAVDTDRSGSISVNELQAALVNGQPSLPCSFSIVQLTYPQETGRVSVLNHFDVRAVCIPLPPPTISWPLPKMCLSILTTPLTSGFDLDTVKMLMNMFVSCHRTHPIEGY